MCIYDNKAGATYHNTDINDYFINEKKNAKLLFVYSNAWVTYYNKYRKMKTNIRTEVC